MVEFKGCNVWDQIFVVRYFEHLGLGAADLLK
jgi:hypothetical protein